MPTGKDIDEQIEYLQKQLDQNKIEEQQRKKQASLDEIEKTLKESEIQNEEYILSLSKQIGEKRIILNYILDELINL